MTKEEYILARGWFTTTAPYLYSKASRGVQTSLSLDEAVDAQLDEDEGCLDFFLRYRIPSKLMATRIEAYEVKTDSYPNPAEYLVFAPPISEPEIPRSSWERLDDD
jgi:hypothetical protein